MVKNPTLYLSVYVSILEYLFGNMNRTPSIGYGPSTGIRFRPLCFLIPSETHKSRPFFFYSVILN